MWACGNSRPTSWAGWLQTSLQQQNQAYAAATGKVSAQSKEAFRAALTNLLERRLFYIPSFKIYGSVAGFYDYGPPGCAIKQNLTQAWRQHFVLEENMLEVECPAVTPEVVLKASGHVDRFTDFMVTDLKTGAFVVGVVAASV
jgi:glycyl-tRNA synthetase